MSDEISPETENIDLSYLKSNRPRSVGEKPKITGQMWSQWVVLVTVSLVSPICIIVANDRQIEANRILAAVSADRSAKQDQWRLEQSDKQSRWMIAESGAQAKNLAEYNLDIWREQKQMDLDQKTFEEHLAVLRDFNKSFVEFQVELRNLIQLRVQAKCGEFLIASGVNVTDQDTVRNDFRQRLLRMEIASKDLVLTYGFVAPALDMDESRLQSLCKELTKIGTTELTEATKLKLKKLSKSTKSEYEKGLELSSIVDNEAATRPLKGIDTVLKEFSSEIQKKLLTVPKGSN